MNAQTPTHPLTQAAIQNPEVLRVIRAAQAPLKAPGEVAHAAGLPTKNIARTMAALLGDALVLHAGDAGYRLTEAGDLALKAIDLADGRLRLDAAATPIAGVVLLAHHQLRANPLNVRKTIDPDELERLADTMAAADGPLQNLLAFPADGEGVHDIAAGERRWRAWGILIERGTWPADIKFEVKIRERTPGGAFFIALAENGSREKLAMIEEARGYLALVEETGWSAREAAMKCGRDPRTVQEMLKVLREADPALITRHEADPKDVSWEDLRESVKEPGTLALKPPVIESPKTPFGKLMETEVLALVEIAARYLAHEGCHPVKAGFIQIFHAYPYTTTGMLQRERFAELVTEPDGAGRQKTYVGFTARAREVLMGEGMWPEGAGRDAALAKARALRGAWTPRSLGRGDYATPWLSMPEPVIGGGATQATPPGPPKAAAGPDKVLTPIERVAMAELAHKLKTQPFTRVEGDPLVQAPKYWLDQHASDLRGYGLIVFSHLGEGAPFAGFPHAGWAWIGAHWEEVTDDILEDEREALPGPWTIGEDGYVTPWLNTTTNVAREIAQPLLREDEEPDGDEYQVARQVLGDVAVALDDMDDFDPLALAERAGIKFPLQLDAGLEILGDDGEPLLELVGHGDIIDDVLRARALLFVSALNDLVRPFVKRATPHPGRLTRKVEDGPVAPIRKSITPEDFVCLEDGARVPLLARHLRQAYGLTPDEYRDRWKLPKDYPMVAANLGADRHRLMRRIGVDPDTFRTADDDEA